MLVTDRDEIEVIIHRGDTSQRLELAPAAIPLKAIEVFPNLKAVERTRFVMLSGLVDKVLTEDKTSTIRFERGAVEYPSGIMLPLFEVTVPNRHENARLVANLQIIRVIYKSLAELDQHDVEKDGRASRNELLETMEHFYGKISANELVTIYEFKRRGALHLSVNEHGIEVLRPKAPIAK